MNKTKEKLQQQFKQNTGRALCDSGGTPQYDDSGNYIGSSNGYGRRYEQLAGKDLDDGPTVWLDGGSLDVTRSAYHFLSDVLEYDAELDDIWQRYYVGVELFDSSSSCDNSELESSCQQFLEWAADLANDRSSDFYTRLRHHMEEHCDSHTPTLMTVFIEFLKICGRRAYSIGGMNTYNGECILDTTLQFEMVRVDDYDYVIMQTHNGCDVRGGYSDPVVYGCDCDDLQRYNHVSLCCRSHDEHEWFSDDGWNWYSNFDACSSQLRELSLVEVEDIDDPEVQQLVTALLLGEKQRDEMCRRDPDKAAYYHRLHHKNAMEIVADMRDAAHSCRRHDELLHHGKVLLCPVCAGQLHVA